MIKSISYLLIFVILGVLVLIYKSRPSGADQRLQREKLRTDSASQAAEMWRQKAAEYFQAYSTSKTEALKMEQRFNYIREENEKLKRRPVIRFTDSQLDSALRARYPG